MRERACRVFISMLEARMRIMLNEVEVRWACFYEIMMDGWVAKGLHTGNKPQQQRVRCFDSD